MAFLALDTSGEYLSLAITDNAQIHTHDVQVGQKHAEHIIITLQQFLANHNLAITQIKGIAYGHGPGSFTGLRIGCAVAQGLAFAHDLPLIGISTLEALALQSTASYIISCLDARMGELYFAAYQQNEQHLTELVAPGLYQPQALPDLPAYQWMGIGNGFIAQQSLLEEKYSLQSIKATAFVRAGEILRLALPKFAANQGVKAEAAQLFYLRDKVAFTTAEQKRR